MSDMTNIQTSIQEALAAARIADLRREAAALHAEHERDLVRGRAAIGADRNDHLADLPSRRVRIGRWVVAFGEAVAGSTRATGSASRSLTATSAGTDDPCDDGHDRLAPAT